MVTTPNKALRQTAGYRFLRILQRPQFLNFSPKGRPWPQEHYEAPRVCPALLRPITAQTRNRLYRCSMAGDRISTT